MNKINKSRVANRNNCQYYNYNQTSMISIIGNFVQNQIANIDFHVPGIFTEHMKSFGYDNLQVDKKKKLEPAGLELYITKAYVGLF